MRTLFRFGIPVLIVIVIGVLAVQWLRNRPPDKRELVEALRIELLTLRTSADSCRTEVAAREERFRSYDARVASLLERVRAYEALDPEGVPADSYPVYLEAFDRYNRAVPGWGEQADSLRTDWDECRALAEAHNSLARSVKRLLVVLGP